MNSARSGKYDLEDRLIDFAVEIVNISQALPFSNIGRHIKNQLLRCGTSPAANYAEAKSAESHSDFIHKIIIALKELRELRVWLLIINRINIYKQMDCLEETLKENEELILILYKSAETAKTNKKMISQKTIKIEHVYLIRTLTFSNT
jgi:four helix bundle protein